MARSRRRKDKKVDSINRKLSQFFIDSSDLVYDRPLEPKKKPLPVNDYLGDRPHFRKTITGNQVTYKATKPVYKKYPSVNDRISFESPKRVLVCRRRKSRREILFKYNKIGKGKGSKKPHRWTDDSKIKC